MTSGSIYFLLNAASLLHDRLMLAYAALCRSEITSLIIGDFDFAHRLNRIRAETTKNRRERIVSLSPPLVPVLAAHLMQIKRAGIAWGALFRSASDRNQDAPLSFWTGIKTVRELALESGMPDISTHTFRHLRLTLLACAGWKLHELATYAGHRDLITTKIYIHLFGRDLAARMAGAIETAYIRMANLIFSPEN